MVGRETGQCEERRGRTRWQRVEKPGKQRKERTRMGGEDQDGREHITTISVPCQLKLTGL